MELEFSWVTMEYDGIKNILDTEQFGYNSLVTMEYQVELQDNLQDNWVTMEYVGQQFSLVTMRYAGATSLQFSWVTVQLGHNGV